MFGWCATGHCNNCIGRYRRFYIGKKKVKRKSIETVIYLDEWAECDHYCHNTEPVEKPKKRTPRRKK